MKLTGGPKHHTQWSYFVTNPQGGGSGSSLGAGQPLKAVHRHAVSHHTGLPAGAKYHLSVNDEYRGVQTRGEEPWAKVAKADLWAGESTPAPSPKVKRPRKVKVQEAAPQVAPKPGKRTPEEAAQHQATFQALAKEWVDSKNRALDVKHAKMPWYKKSDTKKSAIGWLVDRYHVGTPHETIAADIRKRAQRGIKDGSIQPHHVEGWVKEAHARHQANQALYGFVMGGQRGRRARAASPVLPVAKSLYATLVDKAESHEQYKERVRAEWAAADAPKQQRTYPPGLSAAARQALAAAPPKVAPVRAAPVQAPAPGPSDDRAEMDRLQGEYESVRHELYHPKRTALATKIQALARKMGGTVPKMKRKSLFDTLVAKAETMAWNDLSHTSHAMHPTVDGQEYHIQHPRAEHAGMKDFAVQHGGPSLSWKTIGRAASLGAAKTIAASHANILTQQSARGAWLPGTKSESKRLMQQEDIMPVRPVQETLKAYLDMTPAYGRDYKSKKEVDAAWHANKDFIIANVDHPYSGKPANKQSFEGESHTFNLRYNQNRGVHVIRPGQKPLAKPTVEGKSMGLYARLVSKAAVSLTPPKVRLGRRQSSADYWTNAFKGVPPDVQEIAKSVSKKHFQALADAFVDAHETAGTEHEAGVSHAMSHVIHSLRGMNPRFNEDKFRTWVATKRAARQSPVKSQAPGTEPAYTPHAAAPATPTTTHSTFTPPTPSPKPTVMKAESGPASHQLKVARDTIRMNAPMRGVMGGPSHEEAHRVIKQLTGKHEPCQEKGCPYDWTAKSGTAMRSHPTEMRDPIRKAKTCAQCGGEKELLGKAGGAAHYRCRVCKAMSMHAPPPRPVRGTAARYVAR